MRNVLIKTEYIKLDQFLKLVDITGSGGEAKSFIAENNIYVNDEKEERRGRKLRAGDVIKVNKNIFMIVQNGEKSDY